MVIDKFRKLWDNYQRGPVMMKLYAKVKLPSLYRFRGNYKTKVSPFEKFHRWVSEQFGGEPDGYQINVSASRLHPTDAKALNSLTTTWAKKLLPYMSNHGIQMQVGMLNLDIGPAEFDKNEAVQHNIQPGFVYVTDELFKKRDR
jgi:hypothetical protein